MVALVEETDVSEPELFVPPDEEEEEEAPPSRVRVPTPQPSLSPPPAYTELDRNVVSVCFITFNKCSG